MTLDDFVAEANKLGCLLSNMYQCDDGTWFVAIRKLKPEWMVFYGRDKDREACLTHALRQAKRGKSNWPVDAELIRKKKLDQAPAKKKVERVRTTQTRVRI